MVSMCLDCGKFTVKTWGKLDKENKLVFEAVGLTRGDILLNEKIDAEVVKSLYMPMKIL